MKFSQSLILISASLVTGQGHEGHSGSSAAPACSSKLECKMTELLTNPDVLKKSADCQSSKDMDEILKCTYAALGLKPEQIDILTKIIPAINSCAPKADPKMTSCISKCSQGNTECAQKCAEPYQEQYGKCIGKLGGQPNYDIKKDADCSTKCDQDTISEIFDCDYKCHKSIYDGIAGKSTGSSEKDDTTSGSSSNSTDSKSGNSSSSGKDPKSGGSSGGSGGSSGASLGFESKALAIISLPILLSLFLF